MNAIARIERPDGRQAQFFKGLAELAVLSLLSERPHYGLDILERLRTEAGLALAAGTIYPLLHRIEQGGLVHADWRIEDSGTRPRKYYALTAAGKREHVLMLKEWRQLSTALGKFLDRKTKL